MKKVLKLIILMLFIPFIINAEELKIYSNNVLLYNLNDNEIIFEKDAEDKVSIASLTKIMTSLISIENIKTYNQVIMFPKIDNESLWDYSKVGFKTGEEVTYDDLLYSALLPSAADATEALAVLISGSTDKFVELMNEKAKSLNMSNTHFSNTYGKDDENNYSTAEDLLKLIIYALENKKFSEIFTSKKYELNNGKIIQSTINYYSKKYSTLLDVSKIIGSKTGYTDKAGLCMISETDYNNMKYILITLGADYTTNSALQILDNVNISNYYYDNYEYITLVKSNDLLTTIKLSNIFNITEKLYAEKEIKKYLLKGLDTKKEYDGITKIDKSVKIGDTLGYYKIFYNNEEVYKIKIILNDTFKNRFCLFLIKYGIYISLIFILFIILVIFKKKTY